MKHEKILPAHICKQGEIFEVSSVETGKTEKFSALLHI